jgi:FkbM family methyltransferase
MLLATRRSTAVHDPATGYRLPRGPTSEARAAVRYGGCGQNRTVTMTNPPRTLGFVLAATEHGAMILNRFDYHRIGTGAYGVGYNLLHAGRYDPIEVRNAVNMLAARRTHFGDGVVAIDCGANIGVHTLEWARSMTGWGSVVAIEAQERIYYALAGNIALNNCFNARAILAAVAATDGTMRVPTPDYLVPGSFGSLELRQAERTEFIGQTIDYADDKLTEIRTLAIDSLGLTRLDLIKIDVEGMELEVLAGARQTIARCLPIIIVERLKTGQDALVAALAPNGYRLYHEGLNIIAIHPADPSLERVVIVPQS